MVEETNRIKKKKIFFSEENENNLRELIKVDRVELYYDE